MTPRTVMISVDGTRPLSEVRAEPRSWPYSRAPIYLGGQEEIVGYLLKTEPVHRQPARRSPDGPPGQERASSCPATPTPSTCWTPFLRRREHLRMVVG